jgi:hypothetical protein
MLLLKLHGSINWRAIRGRARPYPVDAIVHFETWHTYTSRGVAAPPSLVAIESHLNPEPLIIPPVLVKSGLADHFWLSLVWSKARDLLAAADSITFVGYSLPLTDLAASFLFAETVRPGTVVSIVDLQGAGERKSVLTGSDPSVVPWFTVEAIDFRGALAWSRDLVKSITPRTG